MKGPLQNHYLSEWRLEARNDTQANGYLADIDEFWLNFPEMNHLPFRTMCMPMDSSGPWMYSRKCNDDHWQSWTGLCQQKKKSSFKKWHVCFWTTGAIWTPGICWHPLSTFACILCLLWAHDISCLKSHKCVWGNRYEAGNWLNHIKADALWEWTLD